MESSGSFPRGHRKNFEKNPGLIKRAELEPGFGHLLVVSWASHPIPLTLMVAVMLLMNHLELGGLGGCADATLTIVGSLLWASPLLTVVISSSIPATPPPPGHSNGRPSLADPCFPHRAHGSVSLGHAALPPAIPVEACFCVEPTLK